MRNIFVVTMLFLAACNADQTHSTKGIDTTSSSQISEAKEVRFLWRDSSQTFQFDSAYAQSIDAAERAAIGYVATFIGSDCWWDGEAKEDRSNLKCEVLSALNLGYQCSEKHLGFLRQWFKSDSASLKNLQNCPTIPYTASIQSSFEEIKLSRKGNDIQVFFKANQLNTREGKIYYWTEIDHFEVNHDQIKLVKADKSPIETKNLELK